MNDYSRILPRTYILSHCDFTANLTLTISNVINLEQLRGWYIKDDVVAEWKKVRDDMCLHVHCYVSGPSLLRDLAAEFRYHIFTKEMPLVLKAVLHGDSMLFRENPELMNALVKVYFHSSSKIYNRMECWGPLKDAAEGRQEDSIQGLLTANKEGYHSPKKLARPKSIFQALFAFLL
ncbi:Magnesium dechelatase SGRL [Citrus sinensis]|nr:Magnesium dechelatase SGRL [Citrus sinensis]